MSLGRCVGWSYPGPDPVCSLFFAPFFTDWKGQKMPVTLSRPLGSGSMYFHLLYQSLVISFLFGVQSFTVQSLHILSIVSSIVPLMPPYNLISLHPLSIHPPPPHQPVHSIFPALLCFAALQCHTPSFCHSLRAEQSSGMSNKLYTHLPLWYHCFNSRFPTPPFP